MVSPILITKPTGKRFYWNVDANVGVGSPNNDEDVQLVQFGYFLMARSSSPEIQATDKAVYILVRPGDKCTGREDDPLVRAIRHQQSRRGGIQDGHVSVITTSSGVYPYGADSKSFMLISIVNNVFDATPNDFPRIDKHPRCPPLLKAAVAEKCKL